MDLEVGELQGRQNAPAHGEDEGSLLDGAGVGLAEHDHPLGLMGGVELGEGHRPPRVEAVDRSRHRLQSLRPDAHAADDEQLLLAAGDEALAAHATGEISPVVPAVAQDLGGGLRVAVVAAEVERTVHAQPAGPPLRPWVRAKVVSAMA